MKWIEVSVFFKTENKALAEDLIANAFSDAGIEGVAIEPTDETPADGWAKEVMPLPVLQNRVTGYVADNDLAGPTCLNLKRAVEILAGDHGFEARFAHKRIDEEDWAESWKSFFWPEKIGSRIVVKPTWRDYSEAPGDIIIELDPGMAFGTGTHPTTRLCVQMLETFVNREDVFLDVGTGSGILMAAAYKLGASTVCGIDIDPVAVEISGENLARNRVPAHDSSVLVGDLIQEDRVRDVQERFDIISANILSEVILSLLDRVPAVLKPKGIFICSGIIEENAPAVLEKMESIGFTVLEVRHSEGWTAIAGRRHLYTDQNIQYVIEFISQCTI